MQLRHMVLVIRDVVLVLSEMLQDSVFTREKTWELSEMVGR